MDIDREMRACLKDGPVSRLGVAVSGGGDSVALMALLADWVARHEVTLLVATVDHGLRDASANEARRVGEQAQALGLSHDILKWQGWDGQGNLQDQARQARRSLLTAWARDQGIEAIALGHTEDDQAETVLQRLLRGSGVDGLAAMTAVRHSGGLRWLRPLLGHSRGDLRDWLSVNGTTWIDDPSNDDPGFDRIRLRQAMRSLGLDPEGLADTAARMQRARVFLEQACATAARDLVQISPVGDVEIATEGYLALGDEMRLRLLAHSLGWVASSPYRPRLSSLIALDQGLRDGQKATLAGTIVTPLKQGLIRISRELAAVADETTPPTGLWDRRWQMIGGPAPEGSFVAALGEPGLQFCTDWRETGLPRDSLIAAPALWLGRSLIAAPLAGFGDLVQFHLEKGGDHYFASILSH